MPIDASGNYLSGVSGSGVWLNGNPVQAAPNGWPQFWPTGYVFNAAEDDDLWHVETNNGMVLSINGAAPLYAGGGVWLAALLGGSPCARASWGYSSPNMPLGVAPSGRLFVTAGSYPNNLVGILGFDPDNYTPVVSIADTTLMPGPANFFALDNTRYIWLTGGLTLASSGFSTQPAVVAEPLQIASAPMMVTEATTGVWSAYVLQDGSGVCHPYANAAKGFRVPANAFGFGVWSPASGLLELCWTGNLGQTGPVTRVRVNVADAYPLEPVPPEPPIPPIPPTDPLPDARRLRSPMKVALMLRGKYLGLEPGTTKPYADRTAAGAWEDVELLEHPNKYFSARFMAADRAMAQEPDGDLDSRPAGTFGSWESFFATEQPDGSKLCYRIENGNLVQPAFNVVIL